jgi:hypothetical protein
MRIDVRAALDVAEMIFDERERARGIDVAGQGNRRVPWMVVAPEEGVYLVEAHRLEIGDFTDRRPVIRMIGREQRRQQGHRRETVWAVLVILPALVQHDVALI